MQFFKATTIAEATRAAQALVHASKLLGQSLTHCQALEHVARENGYNTWANFRTAEVQRVDELLTHSERISVASSEANEYGEEEVIYGKNGFALRFSVDDLGNIEHARITDPLGREVVYYVDDEFTEAPREIIAALLRYMSRQATATLKTSAPKDDEAAVTSPGIALTELSSVVVNGQFFYVQSSLGPAEIKDADSDEPVLSLYVDDDGVDHTRMLTKREFLRLTWDLETQGFIGPNGDSYRFYKPMLVTRLAK